MRGQPAMRALTAYDHQALSDGSDRRTSGDGPTGDWPSYQAARTHMVDAERAEVALPVLGEGVTG